MRGYTLAVIFLKHESFPCHSANVRGKKVILEVVLLSRTASDYDEDDVLAGRRYGELPSTGAQQCSLKKQPTIHRERDRIIPIVVEVLCFFFVKKLKNKPPFFRKS